LQGALSSITSSTHFLPAASPTALRAWRSEGQGLFVVDRVVDPPLPMGRPRPATVTDFDELCRWYEGFAADTDIGLPADRPAVSALVAQRVAAGQAWVWDDDGPVSMAMHSAPTAVSVRIQYVYTPPEHR